MKFCLILLHKNSYLRLIFTYVTYPIQLMGRYANVKSIVLNHMGKGS